MESTSILDDDKKGISRSGKAAGNEKKISSRLSSPSYVQSTQSKSPQAILKVASYSRNSSVKNVLEYVSRTDRDLDGIPAEDEQGNELNGKDDVNNLYEQWAEDFERKKAGSKTAPRHATHIVLSAKTDNSEKSVKQVHSAAREFLQKEFADRGYEYLFVIHNDTANPHVHVVIKNKNNILNEKLRIGKAELFDLRQEFSQKLQENGIEAISTLRRDRPEVIQAVAQKLDTMKNQSQAMDERLMKTEKTPAMDTFEKRRNQMLGIERLKREIKNNTHALTPERDQMVKQLKSLQTAISKNDSATLPKQVESTVKFFTDGNKELSEKLNDILINKKPSNKELRADKKRKEAALSKYSERYIKNIKLAMKDITVNRAIPDNVRKQALQTLRKQRRSVEKLQTKAFKFGI